MLESHHLFVLALAHVALFAAVGAGFTPRVEAVVAAAFGAVILFAWAAIASTNIQIVTNSGTVVTQSQPAVGWYAYGMAFISLILAVASTLTWLPTDTEVSNNAS